MDGAPAPEVPSPAEDLAGRLRALAHPNRLRILRLLTQPHHLEEIASALGLARQSVQDHLDPLVAAGLVERVAGRGQRGPVVDYVIVIPRLFGLYEEIGNAFGVVGRELTESIHARLRTERVDASRTSNLRTDVPRLTIVHGMRIGETTLIEGAGPWTIGRDVGMTLTLEYDPFVSTRHAEIRRQGGGFEVVDALSSNGTFLDWLPLPRGGAAPLRNGSLLRIGKSLLLFRAPLSGGGR
ncbi:MAG: FHA domain-containing protein [Thermoplasmatota archaeon]